LLIEHSPFDGMLSRHDDPRRAGMKACERVHAFADGELAGQERDRFIAHLRGCAACQAALESIVALRALAETMNDPPPGE
jgi:anti-sigma factor RsiW